MLFADRDITLSYSPGSLYLNYPSATLPLEIDIPPTLSDDDVEAVALQFLARLDRTLETTGSTYETTINASPSNMLPDSESEMDEDERAEIAEASTARQKETNESGAQMTCYLP